MASINTYDILAIGTPIVDQLIMTTDEFLQKIHGPRGGSESVDYETLCKLLKNSGHSPVSATGGCAANTIKGLAQLGHNCALFGKLGNDEAGLYFQRTMEELGIISKLQIVNKPTAQVACLISPDHERTMRSFLGAGLEMKAQDLDSEIFKNVKLLHIEAYLLDRDPLVQHSMELAKAAGAKISFDLANFEIVEKYKKQMIDLLSNYVDIVFANNEETQALTGLGGEAGCDILKDICEIAVVKLGDKGCLAAQDQEKVFQPGFTVNAVDTTGAGDLFASGFLHGYLQQKELKECARYGNLVASFVVQMVGTEMMPEMWQSIKKQL